jgi:hypothetical protein
MNILLFASTYQLITSCSFFNHSSPASAVVAKTGCYPKYTESVGTFVGDWIELESHTRESRHRRLAFCSWERDQSASDLPDGRWWQGRRDYCQDSRDDGQLTTNLYTHKKAVITYLYGYSDSVWAVQERTVKKCYWWCEDYFSCKRVQKRLFHVYSYFLLKVSQIVTIVRLLNRP